MFAAGRAFEQVRNSIGYPHLNVKIGATHAGITVGEDGATHQCNEDIARIICPIPFVIITSRPRAKAGPISCSLRESARFTRIFVRIHCSTRCKGVSMICVRIMEDYRKGIGKRKESDCR